MQVPSARLHDTLRLFQTYSAIVQVFELFAIESKTNANFATC